MTVSWLLLVTVSQLVISSARLSNAWVLARWALSAARVARRKSSSSELPWESVSNSAEVTSWIVYSLYWSPREWHQGDHPRRARRAEG
ncbi:hypothetical protein GGR52DRAFT_543264 [Hypoxylon sp. FL1284]|nr:hypothetical protein GGR52DRAFT_543264 [Hypoxylon sp. FL1284]